MFCRRSDLAMKKVRRPGEAAGFTLVEVLVALTILSTVVVALAGTMRGMAQTSDRVDGRLARGDDIRVVSEFMRRTLGDMIRHEVASPGVPGPMRLLFIGQADSLTWVGVMPAGYGNGGRHLFRLAGESESGKMRLVLRYTPADALEGLPSQWTDLPFRVLVSDLQQIDFTYQGGPAGAPIQANQWSDPVSLPGHVGVRIADAVGEWPLLTVSVGTPALLGPSGFLDGRR